MAAAISIDPGNGAIRLGDAALLGPHLHRSAIAGQVTEFLETSRDHGNGFAWLNLRELTFGGQAAALSLGFHHELFVSATWSVELPNTAADGGPPSRKAIDEEVAFVRSVLKDMGLRIGRNAWGEVWSSFDARSFMAASGLRYRHS